MNPTDNSAIEFVLPEGAAERLDMAIGRRLPDLSRSHIQKLIKAGQVLADGAPAKASDKLKPGAVIRVDIPEPEKIDVEPEAIGLNIVFEDEHLLVIDKKKGMSVHPAPGCREGTLVNALLHHCGGALSGINGKLRPGIVHRLDKNTSGLLVAAKSDLAHNGLAEQIQNRTAKRVYMAVVHGRTPGSAGTFEGAIGRSSRDRKKMAVVERGGKEAVTHWRREKRLGLFDLVEARLETGRTHQIRVHFSHNGLPVAGDAEYGGVRIRAKGLPSELRAALQEQIGRLQGQALHARCLAFAHPITGKPLEFSAPPPDDIARFIDFLEHCDWPAQHI